MSATPTLQASSSYTATPAPLTKLPKAVRKSSTKLSKLTAERMRRTTAESLAKIEPHRMSVIPSGTIAAMSQRQVDALTIEQREALVPEQVLCIIPKLPAASLKHHLDKFVTKDLSTVHQLMTANQRKFIYNTLLNFNLRGYLTWEDVRYVGFSEVVLAIQGLFADRRLDFFNAYLDTHRDRQLRECGTLAETLNRLWKRGLVSPMQLHAFFKRLDRPEPIAAYLMYAPIELRAQLRRDMPPPLVAAIDQVK